MLIPQAEAVTVSHPDFDVAVLTALKLGRERFGCYVRMFVHVDEFGTTAGCRLDPDQNWPVATEDDLMIDLD